MLNFLRKQQPEPDLDATYPFRIGLRADTQANRDDLVITLCAALKLLCAAEPENQIALEAWRVIYGYWPQEQPKPRAANIVQFPQRRMR